MRQLKYIFRPLMVIGLLGGLAFWGCDTPFRGQFLDGNDVDPNNPTSVTIDQKFTAIQVRSYMQHSGHLARSASVWMQQMAGTDRQYLTYGRYVIAEDTYDTEFNNWYGGGGLIDIRAVRKEAEAKGMRVYAGFAKFYEAWNMGTAAAVWGDIPFSEAATDVATPKLDDQKEVYAAVQSLLSEAIADLGSGAGRGPGANDFGYGGNAAKMIAAAHTLKARFYLHWTEVDPANYQLALNEAEQGIASIADNFTTKHDASKAGEWNVWHQFYLQRDSYTRAGKFCVDLLKSRNDPRLTIYYNKDKNGDITGADPGEPNTDASELGDAFRSAGSPFPLITYEENELIKAECNYKLGNEAAALQNLNNVRAALEQKWGFAAGTYPALNLSGQALLDEILTEKYLSLFLQIEVWNDYKRNCFPALQTYNGLPMPARLFYSNDERNANPNIPIPDQQPIRNDNDPNGCN